MKSIKVHDLEKLRLLASESQAKGNYFVAEQIYQILLNLETLAFGEESGATAYCIYKLAELKFAQNQMQEGRELYLQAIALWEKQYPTDYLGLLCYTEALTKVSVRREPKPAQTASLAYLPLRNEAMQNLERRTVKRTV